MSEPSSPGEQSVEGSASADERSSQAIPSSPPLPNRDDRRSDLGLRAKSSQEAMDFKLEADDRSASDATEVITIESDGTLKATADSVKSDEVKNETVALPKAASRSDMPPPPPPASVKTARAPENRPSRRMDLSPPSGQGSQKPRQSGSAGSARGQRADTHGLQDSIPEDPEEPMAAFDWIDLEQRYHDRVQALDVVHNEATEEFASLCSFFRVWADAGSNHEVDRSFKRLKTQMALVQHHEDQLEQRRQHYIKVVDAFKSALELLVV